MEKVLIYEKMSQAIGKVDAVTKSKKNSQQGYVYRGIDDAMSAVNKVLSDLQLCLSINYETEKDEMISVKEDKLFNKVRVKGLYKIYAIDGSCIECSTVGIAYDYSDKAANKAMSFALKYFLFQAFMIPVEDIEDGDKDNISHPKTHVETHKPVDATKEIERIKMLMPKLLQDKLREIGAKGPQVISLVSAYKGDYERIMTAGEETQWDIDAIIKFA
jgi:hypothetical protein